MKRSAEKILPEGEEIAAVSCAVQNMYLSATAYGLGAYWSTGGGVYSAEMKTFLQLEERDKCLGIFYLGCCDKITQVGKRRPIHEKTQWIKD